MLGLSSFWGLIEQTPHTPMPPWLQQIGLGRVDGREDDGGGQRAHGSVRFQARPRGTTGFAAQVGLNSRLSSISSSTEGDDGLCGSDRALRLILISSSAEGEDGESSPEMSVWQRAVSDWRCGSGGGSGHTHLRLSWLIGPPHLRLSWSVV
jgi:hypothetical protein